MERFFFAVGFDLVEPGQVVAMEQRKEQGRESDRYLSQKKCLLIATMNLRNESKREQ